ncbi:phenoloxidase-activating factor 2-like isoform X2 [Colias croceus]|nr:phenoloxidase-activating factor 2-like isoform X2 [Colias croceus]
MINQRLGSYILVSLVSDFKGGGRVIKMSRFCVVLLVSLPFTLCKPQASSGGGPNLDPVTDASMPCTLQNGSKGECVPYFQCDESLTIIDDGSDLLDLRSSVCAHYLDVCCAHNNGTKTTTTPVPEVFHSLHDEGDTHITQTAFSMPVSSIVHKSQELPGCGWNNPKIRAFKTTTREVAENSVYANYGDFPFMVAIIKQNNISDVWSPRDYVGGAVLIHPSYVLTVAHKVVQFEPSEIKCRAGEYDTQTIKEQFLHQERNVKEITIHENYFRASLYNDIALLSLEKPFDLTPNIGIGCLGKNLPGNDVTCFAMGWGKEFDKNYADAIILKKVKLNLVDRSTCERQMQDERFGPLFKLHESFVCAGAEEGVDTCKGDGGSPLVCTEEVKGDDIRYVVYGLVAYGLRCGVKDVPGVYANIPNLYNWIDKQMNGQDKPYIY